MPWIMRMGYGHLRRGPSFVWTVPQYLGVRRKDSTVHPMKTTQGGRQ